MAYASVTYTSASGTTFALTNSNGDPIPYIRQSDIKVYVNNVLQTVTTDYTFNTAGTAIVLNSPVSGATVLLQRITDITDPTVVYTAGSTLTAQDLNNADNQIRYGLQEFQDSVNAGGGVPDGDKGDITVAGNGTIWTIDSGAVVEAKIASGAVTETKIGTGAVTSAKIADGTIVNADINASAAIAHSKLANITAGSVLLGDASNVPTATALSGDVTVDSSGVTAIGSGVIVDADINNSAAIALSKLATGALPTAITVASANIVDGTIVDADINANAEIAVSKLADGTARQLLQTDAAGTGVEWTSNVDIPGTLDVTGAAVFDSTANIAGNLTVDTNTLFVDATNNRVGIGTTSPGANLYVNSSSNTELVIDAPSGTPIVSLLAGGAGEPVVGYKNSLRAGTVTGVGGAGFSEKARLDSSGRLLVGTSTAAGDNTRAIFQGYDTATTDVGVISIQRGSNAAATNENLGFIDFQDSRPGKAARIACVADGTWGAGDYPGRLVFSTTADGASSPTERMRISQNGTVLITAVEGALTASGAVTNNELVVFNNRNTGTTARFAFRSNNLERGSITWTDSATAFNTSSDYRLKENIAPVDDGIERLMQLKPCRFNFIIEPDRVVDGFIAHEVQDIVPEAINGEKDAVDDEGNPQYQGIDQSKLVPLLTAALQEAVAKIEVLEAKVAALEAS